MDFWRPDPNTPELLDWWRPLLRAAARARSEDVGWPIYIDEFSLVGLVKRGPRPPIWIFRHRGNEGLVLVDPKGTPYRFVSYSSGRAAGRFKEINMYQAIWGAGLPNVVKPVWYEQPPPRYEEEQWWGSEEPQDPTVSPSRRAGKRGRRRHLRLVSPPA